MNGFRPPHTLTWGPSMSEWSRVLFIGGSLGLTRLVVGESDTSGRGYVGGVRGHCNLNVILTRLTEKLNKVLSSTQWIFFDVNVNPFQC